MAQPHLLYSLRDPFRLLPVQSYRATRLHGAKATTARADTPQDHECGRSMAPAFPNIWAACLLANRVQFLATHQILQIFVISPLGGRTLSLSGRRFRIMVAILLSFNKSTSISRP